MRDGSSWVEPVLSWDKCVLLKDHNAVTPVRLKPAALRSRVKHSTTEPHLWSGGILSATGSLVALPIRIWILADTLPFRIWMSVGGFFIG